MENKAYKQNTSEISLNRKFPEATGEIGIKALQGGLGTLGMGCSY